MNAMSLKAFLVVATMILFCLCSRTATAENAQVFCMSALGTLTAAPRGGQCPILTTPLNVMIGDSATELTVEAQIGSAGQILSEDTVNGVGWIASIQPVRTEFVPTWTVTTAPGLFQNKFACVVTAVVLQGTVASSYGSLLGAPTLSPQGSSQKVEAYVNSFGGGPLGTAFNLSCKG